MPELFDLLFFNEVCTGVVPTLVLMSSFHILSLIDIPSILRRHFISIVVEIAT
jgi:hypothetical protein